MKKCLTIISNIIRDVQNRRLLISIDIKNHSIKNGVKDVPVNNTDRIVELMKMTKGVMRLFISELRVEWYLHTGFSEVLLG